MRTVYIDTSVFLRAMLPDADDHQAALELVRAGRARLVSSELLWLEADRAVVRITAENALAARLAEQVEAALLDIDMIPLDRRIITAARAIPQVIKSLDAIHVASAEQIGGGLACVATNDKTMAAVASQRNLTVLDASGALELIGRRS